MLLFSTRPQPGLSMRPRQGIRARPQVLYHQPLRAAVRLESGARFGQVDKLGALPQCFAHSSHDWFERGKAVGLDSLRLGLGGLLGGVNRATGRLALRRGYEVLGR